MKIHEHQGKELLRGFDVPVAAGGAFFSAAEAADFAGRLFADGARAVAVKAQIHAGGRGKGGGVKIARDAQAAAAAAESILGMNLVTPQTGAGGQIVKRLLIEAGVEIEREFYLGLVVDRARQQIVVMGSSEGGMEIEEVAARAPEKIQKMWIDPVAGIDDEAATVFARAMEIPAAALGAARQMIGNLARAFAACDASMIEINPLALTADGGLLALDAKINFDDNAKFRHPEWETLRDRDEGRPGRDRRRRVRAFLYFFGRRNRLHGERRRPRDGDDGYHQTARRRARRIFWMSAAARMSSKCARRFG